MSRTDSVPDIASNLATLCARINSVAGERQVTLVAVSKGKDASLVERAIAAGQTVFGENRVQEAAAKFPALRRDHGGIVVHMIGALQVNKARDAVRLFDEIESLDRPKLADALANAADREGKLPYLLVQVNIGDEPQKSGVPREDADDFIRAMRHRFGKNLRGLMAIPPAGVDPAPYFRELVAMADQHGLPVRSIGMSGDFEIAIRCGATQVRIGSRLFGRRG